nr:reverse transcriptase domain-containing protein [Tanacetum cinerariifolium]
MMADQRTMAQLLQAPTEGYEDAIIVPAITTDNFELKHGLLTLSKSKLCYSRNKPVVAKVSTNTSTSGISPDVVELKDMVKALLLDKKSQNQAPAIVKAVEESYVTFGGAHSYHNYPATDGNVYRDNIQEFVSQASAVNYRPPMMSNQIRPLGFPPVPNNQDVQLNQRNNQNCVLKEDFSAYVKANDAVMRNMQTQGVLKEDFSAYVKANDAVMRNMQTQGVLKEDFSAYVKANDAVMRNMQTQGQNMQNQLTNLTDLLTKFVNSNNASTLSSGTLPSSTIANPRSDLKAITTRSGVSYNGPQILPSTFFLPKVVENKPEATKDIVHPTNNGSTKDVQPQDKLCELARTPLNEQCSAVLLKKLPEKLGDPDKFLIPYDFPGKAECLALADLGVSINLMPLSVWNKLSLPDLTPTCMTLELVDHSISHPVGVAEDIYVKVGSFHFSAEFVVIDFDADPRVPLILRRSFLKTRRALIDVFKGELTLRVGKEAITFNLDQTSRYSANYNEMTSKRIDVIDMACEEYSQEVPGFYDVITSGNPTPYYDPIVSITSPTLTKFRNSDFLLEEVDAFFAIEDDLTSPEVDQSYLDPEGDILLLEAFLNDDPSLNSKTYLPTSNTYSWKEFPFKVIDTKGAENMAADHLSRLENPHQNVLDPKKINESLPLETLNLVSTRGNSSTPWFADFTNYHAGNFVQGHVIPTENDRGTHFCNDQFAKVMQKCGVTHRLATPYHPQTSGQVEVSNRGLKRILERTVGENRASWSKKLDDALWAFQTAYKTPIGCTPYKLVYVKACHLPIKLEHNAYWALKHANFDLKTAGKLKSRWSGPFTISQVYPYGTVELAQPDGPNFKVNGHRLKHYFGEDVPKVVVPDLQTFLKDY